MIGLPSPSGSSSLCATAPMLAIVNATVAQILKIDVETKLHHPCPNDSNDALVGRSELGQPSRYGVGVRDVVEIHHRLQGVSAGDDLLANADVVEAYGRETRGAGRIDDKRLRHLG